MKFTNDDWRDFEDLIFSILYDILKTQYEDVKGIQTRACKDGGFDGRFYLPSKDSFLLDSEINMVFEVKLRSDKRKDLPLSEFSKAIIISINMAANALTIATNLNFSKLTTDLLLLFSNKTGLIINKLSGNEIRKWLNDHKEFEKGFKNQHLIGFIKSTVNTDSNICDEQFKMVFRETDHTGEFINENRKKTCNQIVDFIIQTSNSIILSGEAGVGKSFLIDKILDELTNRQVLCLSINLKCADTPRTVFIRILSNIWHISEEYLLSMNTEDLKEAVYRIGTSELDSNLVDAILCSFEKNIIDYSKKADVFNRSLILYLKKLLGICATNKKIVVSVSDINVCTKELLDFICQLTEGLMDKIQLLLELRTSEYLDSNMSSIDWEKYEKKIRSLNSHIHEFEIQKLSSPESMQYIDILLSDKKIPFEAKDKIISYAGRNPLFIKSFIDYLKICYDFSSNPNEFLSTEISTIYVDNKLEIVDLLISRLAEKNPITIEIFLLLFFFSGNIQLWVLEDILKITISEIPSEIFKTDIVFLGQNELRTSHLIYQEIIDDCRYASFFNRKCLAEEILSNAENYERDPEKLLELKFKLFEASERYSNMVEMGIQLGKNNFIKGQYTSCEKYVKKSIDRLDNIYVNDKYCLIQVQLYELFINAGFYTKNVLEESKIYIQQLEELFNSPPQELTADKEYGNYYISFLLILNQYNHHKGEFKKTYDAINAAKQYVLTQKKFINKSLLESVWVEYLIAEKEVNGLISAIHEIETALKKCVDSAYLQFTINTLWYTYYNDWAPDLACRKIKENIGLYSDLSTAEVYHNKVHYLNARFNLKHKEDNDGLLKEAIETLKEAHKIGLKNEVGRIENIIGNIYFSEGNLNKAKEFYEYGIKIFEKNPYISNEWPIMANYCAILFELQAPDAILYLEKIIILLLEHYRDRINKISFEKGKYPKYYAIFYIFMILCDRAYKKDKKNILRCIEKIRQNISLPEIVNITYEVENRTFLMDPEFSLSIYMYDNHFIMGY